MYKSIQNQKSVVDKYSEKLSEEGIFSTEEGEKYSKEFLKELEKDLAFVDSNQTSPR